MLPNTDTAFLPTALRLPVHDPPPGAVERCRAITAAHSSTFYLGSRFFPPDQRRAVWAVYAACRTGDDIADELEPAAGREALERWRHGVLSALHGDPGESQVERALAWAASRYPLQPAAFQELYLGLSMDLEGRRYASLGELLVYCRRVAGTVGWMVAPVCGYEGGDITLERALKLGMAMQLTNVLRDVGEDLARDRLYLPADLMERHGVREDGLRAGVVSAGYRDLLRDLASEARRLYAEGRAGIPSLNGPGRLAVGVAAAAYEGILYALERQGWDNLRRRARVSAARKLLVIPGVWWSLRRTRPPA